ncbi:MAG: STAS domain-containing protein [Bacteroidota bacterium]|nr:STAS domain-containing protein [Bacteroidota bacterium]
MELQTKKTGNALVVSARGRLDANWSDYFTDAFLGYIRQGEHELVVDAKELHFLSSAGIRSLIMINKELARVKGKFIIIKANEFVRSTLETTGLGSWLMKEVTDTAFDESISNNEQAVSGNYFKLREGAFMQLNCENTWKPWEAVKEDQVKKISFKPDSYALGIGSPISGEVTSGVKFGEYLAVGGNLVYQPPEERSHPDYLLPLENFTPALLSIQSLLCQGEMAHLLRFAPEGDKTSCGIGELVAQALQLCDSDMVAFTILAEIDGLVGAVMIKSPSENKTLVSGLSGYQGLDFFLRRALILR